MSLNFKDYAKKDISYINSKFDMEELISFQGIKQGIENTNYLLKEESQLICCFSFGAATSQRMIGLYRHN